MRRVQASVTELRIVLDTNVLVSALINPGGNPRKLFDLWARHEYELVTSNFQLDELRRVFAYDKLRRFITPTEADMLLDRLEMVAVIVDELPEIDASCDPDDNFILATAVAGKADFVVSGDKRDIVALGSIYATPIVTVSQCVEILASRE